MAIRKICELCGAKLKNIDNSVSVCPVCGTYSGGIDPVVLRIKKGLPVTPEDGKQYVKAGKQILFGRYPQSIAREEAVDRMVKCGDGRYHSDFDNCDYVRLNADPYSPFVKYSNGKMVNRGALNYFKVEPIVWRILRITGGVAYLITDNIIDCGPYQALIKDKYIGGEMVYANNWEHSQLRNWLNTTFIRDAFTADEAAIIQTTINNTANSGFYDDEYSQTQKDTDDKAFVLAYKEIFEMRYGVGHYDNRSKKLTDYTKAKGVQVHFDGTVYGSGLWWLRSAGGQSHYVAFVDYQGIIDINGYLVGCGVSIANTSIGIAPCIRIKL